MKVFISGPYTKGDIILNIRDVIDAAESLSKMGHIPYLPHINAMWHMVYKHEPSFWYSYDLEWLKECDCILRLPGESVGADNEVRVAKELNIPVYYSVEAFKQ